MAGGLLGYAIGALLYESLGQWLIQVYGLEGGVEAVRAYYGQYGAWFILLKGLTPIPYKLVTITSGFAGYDLVWFTSLSLVTRGLRFAALAVVLHRFGNPLKKLLDRHLGLAAILLGTLVVGGFAAIGLLH